MKFYIYNAEGYLSSILETDDKRYPQPENSTQVEPPTLGQNQICRFDGEVWILEERPEPQPVEPTPPTMEEYLIDLDFRISLLELGL